MIRPGPWQVALVVALGLALAADSRGSCPQFSPASVTPIGGATGNSAVGDFNGDGALDIVVATGAANVSISFGNGHGSFQAATPHATTTASVWLLVADLDRDGDTDIASAGAGVISVLENNGNGTFQASQNYATGANARWIGAGDFNRDGMLDLVASVGEGLVLHTGDGSGAFPSYVTVFSSADLGEGAIADFDRDGHLDIVVGSGDPGSLIVLRGGGDGTFPSGQIETHPLDTPIAGLTAEDFDLDGLVDVIVVLQSPDTNHLYYARGNGDGTLLGNPGSLVPHGSTPLVADLDGDGHPDLIVPTDAFLYVFLAARGGPSGVPIALPVLHNSVHVVAGDFNRDGKPDLASSGYQGETGSTLAIAINESVCQYNCGLLGNAGDFPAGDGAVALALADFDRNAIADLVVANRLVDTVSVLPGTGTGTFLPSVSHGAGDEPVALTTGDFNGDGRADVAVANSGSSNVSVLLGAAGTLGTATMYAAGSSPSAIVSGDFNRDGKTDLAVANHGGGTVLVLTGAGDGTFAAGASVSTGTGPTAIAVADLDRDGVTDLVVAADGDLMLLQGDGTGGFSALPITALQGGNGVAVADFNRDGSDDIAMSTASTVEILLGGEVVPLSIAPGTSIRSIAMADLNADGILDLVVTDAVKGLIVLRGIGDGTFVVMLERGTGGDPRGVVTGDLNLAGQADVVVANFGSDSVSVILNDCPAPDLTVVKSHEGDFAQGQNPATYTIVVSNAGQGPTVGGVQLSDNLPDSLGLLAMAGDGWDCVLTTCSRSDVLAAGQSYPPVTLSVEVAGWVSATVLNSVYVTGADLNPDNNVFYDEATVRRAADLTVVKSHEGDFVQGQNEATYTIVVSNVGESPTLGPVQLYDTLPDSLNFLSMAGDGWDCVLTTCSRSDVLAAGESYPPLTLLVEVAEYAPATVVNSVLVMGNDFFHENNAFDDTTTIIQFADLIIGKRHDGPFTQGESAKKYTLLVRNAGGGSTTGAVTVTDSLPSGLIATAIGGSGWTCDLSTLSCTREDVLAPLTAWPPVVVTVDVADDAPLLVTNTAAVSGGGELLTTNNTAADPTTIDAKATCGAFAIGATFATGLLPAAVVARDFDADGHDDLLVLNRGDRTVVFARGNGDGSFQAPAIVTTFPLGDPSKMTAGHVDSDGHLDFVVAFPYPGAVAIVRGRGDGTFYEPTGLFGGEPVDVAIVDLDLDGDNDLAMAAVGEVIIARRGAGGSFVPTSYEIAGGPAGIVSADFDNDGDPDLAVIDVDTTNVSVLLNNGDGTFGDPSHYGPFGTVRAAIAAADFDDDGFIDLVVGGMNAPLLRGDGSGLFTAAGTFNLGDYPSAFEVGDFDGDGRADLAAALPGSNRLAVVVQPASITRYELGLGTLSVAAGDFNGDGIRDLAVANESSSDVAVLIAGCPDLTVTKTHTGDFSQGQSGATYTITVTNAGTVPSTRMVEVVDALPAGLTATAISGNLWDCDLTTLRCVRYDLLASGESYPDITVTVDVASYAPPHVINHVSVATPREKNAANNEDADGTTILQIPDLTITKTHVGNFAQGQTGRSFTILVTNSGGGSTTSVVTVVDSLPAGLQAMSMGGDGWSCNAGIRTCTRGDVLASGASYPPITLTVSVAADAPPSVSNSVTVSGGGQTFTGNDTATDLVTILVRPASLTAQAISLTQVALSWPPVAGATHYEIYRRFDGNGWTLVGIPLANSFVDLVPEEKTTYLYRVHAADDINLGLPSPVDLATTILFTDGTIVPLVTVMKAAHVTELRTAVNAVRRTAGLASFVFTDEIAAGSIVRLIHMLELREALHAARSALGLAPVSYSDAALTTTDPIRAADVRELRSGVR